MDYKLQSAKTEQKVKKVKVKGKFRQELLKVKVKKEEKKKSP